MGMPLSSSAVLRRPNRILMVKPAAKQKETTLAGGREEKVWKEEKNGVRQTTPGARPLLHAAKQMHAWPKQPHHQPLERLEPAQMTKGHGLMYPSTKDLSRWLR